MLPHQPQADDRRFRFVARLRENASYDGDRVPARGAKGDTSNGPGEEGRRVEIGLWDKRLAGPFKMDTNERDATMKGSRWRPPGCGSETRDMRRFSLDLRRSCCRTC